jgi:hypothetical protein
MIESWRALLVRRFQSWRGLIGGSWAGGARFASPKRKMAGERGADGDIINAVVLLEAKPPVRFERRNIVPSVRARVAPSSG